MGVVLVGPGRAALARDRGGGIEGGGEGVALVVDSGQERHRLLGLVEEAVAVGQESDPLLVLGQRGRQLGLAALQVRDDPFELSSGPPRSSVQVRVRPAWALISSA